MSIAAPAQPRKEAAESASQCVAVVKSKRFPTKFSEISDGGSLNAYKLVEALHRSGHQVVVFVRQEPGELSDEACAGFRIVRIPFTPSQRKDIFGRDYEEAISFGEALTRHPDFRREFSAVHVHHWTSAHFLRCQRRPRGRVVYTPHLLAAAKARTNDWTLPAAVAGLEWTALSHADAVISLSHAEMAEIKSIVGPRDGLHRIPNGVDRVLFDVPNYTARNHSSWQLLTIGRLSRQKGIDVVLNALILLAGQGHDNLRLQIAGGSYLEDAYEAEIRDLAAHPCLAGRVAFLGHVSPHQIPTLLAECDLYLQPSRFESQGIAILEAMAACRPVVAACHAAVEEGLNSERVGWLVPPGNPDSLAKVIAEVLDHPAEAQRRAQAARVRALDYQWEEVLSRSKEVLLCRT